MLNLILLNKNECVNILYSQTDYCFNNSENFHIFNIILDTNF